MENRGFLNWGAWSIIRKCQFVGALTGAWLTVLVHGLALIFGHGGNFEGWMLIVLWLAIAVPAAQLSGILGWDWEAGSVYEISIPMFLVMLLINSTVMAVIATTTGYILGSIKNRN